MSFEELPAGPPEGAGGGRQAIAPAERRARDQGPPAGQPDRRRRPRGEASPGAAALDAPHRRRDDERTWLARLGGFIALHLWRATSRVLGHLPASPAWHVFGWALMVTYYVWPAKRRWAVANMAHVLGVPPDDPAAGRLARRAYRNYGRYLVELMRLPWSTPEQREHLLEVQGVERIEEILATSKGVIVVAGHLGNNEAAAAGFASLGLPISVVGDDTGFGGLFELLEEQRASWGVKIIPWRNLRAVFGVLRSKGVLVLLVDWGYRPDGIPVRLFDAWTTLPAGPAVLAAKHGATIVPIIVSRIGDGRFRAAPGEPILVPSDDPVELRRATQNIADQLEQGIAAAPDQWYIFKPIWPETTAEQERLARQAGGDGLAPEPG